MKEGGAKDAVASEQAGGSTILQAQATARATVPVKAAKA